MPAIMAKKKKPVQKSALYVEIPTALKQRLDHLAERHMRKLNAEVTIALERYADEQEASEPEEPTDPDE